MNLKSMLFFALIIFIKICPAQNARFVTEGIIVFEKTANAKAIEEKMASTESLKINFRQSLPQQQQFKTMKSTLTFSNQQTLFTPEDMSVVDNMLPAVPQFGTVFKDLKKELFISQRQVFDQQYLVKDSLRKINWKLTGEMRTIAGYECRRANAIVMDSIYVVAFYTDKIPVSGGPESFGGLPGMILGVALPHYHITWFAKSVTDQPVPASSLTPPSKGKPTNSAGLKSAIEEVIKKMPYQHIRNAMVFVPL